MKNNYHLTFSNTTGLPRLLLWLIVLAIGLVPSVIQAQTISGTVFRDFNSDGVQSTSATSTTFIEPGVAGVVVTAYSSNSATAPMSATTNANGSYALTVGATTQFRVEFSNLPTGDFEGFKGTQNGTAIQFVNGGNSAVNFAINYPSNYCQSNPNLAVACFVSGDPIASGSTVANEDAIVMVPFGIPNASTTSPTKLASASQVGSVWGAVYQRSSKKLFTSALLKRHVGLGTLGLGGIYVTTTTGPTSSTYVDLENLGIDLGQSLLGARGLPASGTTSSNDANAFNLVGKIGLGSLALSDDESKLFVTDLFNKKVIVLNIGNPAKATITAADMTTIAIPTTACTDGVARPFAIRAYRGKIYVGVVCTGENNISTSTSNLKASVYVMDEATLIFNPTPILTTTLNYTKGYIHAQQTAMGNTWSPWISNFSDLYDGGSSTAGARRGRAQPILSSIDFTDTGDMLLGFMDRGGHQLGYNQRNTTETGANPSLYNGYIGGDLLVARLNGTTWTLENNGTLAATSLLPALSSTGAGNGEGPGNGEFFAFDKYPKTITPTIHEETFQGGMAVIPGTRQVVATVMDPLGTWSGGFSWFNTQTGGDDKRYEVYLTVGTGANPVTYGKANGLGVISAVCDPAPIQIGNRVWQDTNNNGVQDAGEPALAGVRVQLSGQGIPANTTVLTGTNGEYYFSNATGTNATGFVYSLTGLTSGSSYSLTFPTSASAGILTLSTKPNTATGTNADAIDTDASAAGVISFTLGGAGQNNFSYDAGYAEVPPCLVSLTTTPGTCDPVTNQYIVSGTISLTGTSGGIATITDGAKSTTVNVAASATAVAYSLSGLTSNGASHTLIVNLPGCGSATTSYTAPASCLTYCPGNLLSNASMETGSFPTSATAFAGGKRTNFITATPTGWTPATNTTKGANFWVQSNEAHSGTKFLYTYSTGTTGGGDDACNQISVSGLQGGQCYQLCVWAADAKADGLASGLSLEIQQNNGGPFSYTAIAVPDNAAWSDANASVIPWQQYCYNITTAPGVTGFTLWISANTEVGGATSYLVLDDACLVSCASCKIAATATPTTCNSATNEHTVSGTISLTSTSGGIATITDGTKSTTVNVAASATSVSYSLSGLTSNGASHTVTISLPGCGTATATYTSPASCTAAAVVCSFSATATASCNTNGTLSNSADDFLYLLLTPTGPFGQRFTLSATQAGSPISLSLSNGNSFTSLTYGYPTPLRAPAGTPGNGNIILTLTDLTNATCTQQVTVTDPGACTVGACVGSAPQTVTYSYRTPFLTTDLDNEPIKLPQFNDPTRTLTKVDLTYGILEGSNFLAENTAATAQSFRPTITSDVLIVLGASTLLNPSLSYTPGFIAIPAGITVAAQGSYGGDLVYGSGTNVSTLEGMSSWLNTYMQDIFVDPRTDLRWVTNATGSATTDDDIYVMPVQSLTAAGVSSFTSTADLAQFLGSGQVPAFTVSTFNGLGLTGGGGNVLARQNTKAYGYATVIYTYTCNAAVCSLTATATPTVCNSLTNQYTVNGTISLTNNTTGGVASITDGTKSTTVTVGASATSVAYSLTGLTSGTGSHTVTVSLPGCGTATATYTAPASCTVAPVELSVVVGAPVCNSLTNNYTATGTVSFSNAVASTLTITDNGTTVVTISVTAGQTTTSFSVSGLSNATSHTVIAALTGGTSASTTYTAPVACTVCSTSITTTVVANGQVGTTYSQTITATGGMAPYVYSLLGTLPAGLSLSAGGVISGTPTTAATSSFTVNVTDAKSCSDAQPLTITNSALPVCSLTATATPGECNTTTNTYSVIGTVSATNTVINNAFTQSLTVALGSVTTTVLLTSDGPVSYTLAGLPSDGLTKTVLVFSSATACGSTSVPFTAPASCTVAPPVIAIVVATPICNTITNNYTATGTVSLSNAVASTLTITDNGITISTISVTAGQTTASFSVSGQSTTASHTVIATLTGGPSASTTYTAPVACTVCSTSITTTALANGQIGTPYSQTLTATGDTRPYVYMVLGNLPPGLNLDPTGVISGTPTLSVSASFSIQVTDAKSCSDVQLLTITIANLPVCSLTATATPGLCNTATNQYTVTGTISATNTTGAQSLTVSAGSVNTIVTLTDNGPVAYTLTGLISDGLVKTVSVLSSATACGSASVTFTAPASCTVAPPTASLGDFVFEDVNNDGTQDSGDLPIQGATVTLLQNGSVVATATTSVSGLYSFTGLTPGIPYSVSFTTPTGFSVSTSANVGSNDALDSDAINGLTGPYTLTAGENNPSVDAGFIRPAAPTPRLLLAKMVSTSKAKLGDVISYTVVLANAGPVSATNVVVNDLFSNGLSLLPASVSVSSGTYTPGGSWTIETLPAGATATLAYSTSILTEGVHVNTASIPGDEAKVCTTVPYSVCKGTPYAIELTAPSGYTRYQWYLTTPTGTTLVSDVTATSANAATAGSYTVTQAGEYKVVVDEGVVGSCPDMSCCPVIVEEVEVPQYTAMGKNPTCVGTTPQSNGQITLMNLGIDPTVYVYQVSTGSSFSAATALSATPVGVPANGVVATGLAAGSYTVRVWVLIEGQPSCPRDVTVELVANCACPEEICVPVIIRKTKSITGR